MGFFSAVVDQVLPIGRPAYTIVDTETTGLSPKRDRIIEFGVVIVDKRFRECQRWPTLINAQKKITKGPYKVETLAKKCHVLNPNAHAAVYDAATTAAVMRRLGASKPAKAIKKQDVPFDADIVASWPLESRPPLPH